MSSNQAAPKKVMKRVIRTASYTIRIGRMATIHNSKHDGVRKMAKRVHHWGWHPPRYYAYLELHGEPGRECMATRYNWADAIAAVKQLAGVRRSKRS